MGIMDLFRKKKKDLLSEMADLLKVFDIMVTPEEMKEMVDRMTKKLADPWIIRFTISNAPPHGKLRYQKSGWSLHIKGRVIDVNTNIVDKAVIVKIFSVAAVLASVPEIAISKGRHDAVSELLKAMPSNELITVDIQV